MNNALKKIGFLFCSTSILTLGSGSVFMQPVLAQGAADTVKTAGDIAYGDLADSYLVPTSPAFTLLGVSPSNVIRPTNPKDLGVALLNGTDATGTLQQGVAIEFSPHFLIQDRKLTIREFQEEGFGARLLANTQISIATSEAASDGDTTRRLAVGFRTVIINKADQRQNTQLLYDAVNSAKILADRIDEAKRKKNDLTVCRRMLTRARSSANLLKLRKQARCTGFKELLDDGEIARLTSEPVSASMDVKKLGKVLVAQLPDQAPLDKAASQTVGELEADYRAEWTSRFKKQQEAAWNATNLTVGGALTLASESGAFGDLSSTGYATYASYSLGSGGGDPDKFSWFEKNAQLVMHARYQTNQLVTALSDAAMVTDTLEPFEQDVLTLASLLRIRGPRIAKKDVDSTNDPDFAFFAEASYTKAFRPQKLGDDSSFRYGGGIELKLTKNASIQFSVGKETGNKLKRDGTFAVGDLKFAF